MASQAQALTLAFGAVALTAYNRGLIQDAIGALRSGGTPLAESLGGASSVNISNGGITQTPFAGGNDALAAAENATTAEKSPSDWLNWCLQWVDDTRARLGLSVSTGPGGRAATAANACAQHSLTKGIAPRGASVCFAPTPTNAAGHIGISQGNCQYMSAGLPGGVQVQDYCNNGGYLGYYQ